MNLIINKKFARSIHSIKRMLKEARANSQTSQKTKKEIQNTKSGETNLKVVGNKKDISSQSFAGSEKMSLMQLNLQLADRSYSLQRHTSPTGQRFVKLAVNLWGLPPQKNIQGRYLV